MRPLTVTSCPGANFPLLKTLLSWARSMPDFSLAVSSARYATACRLCSASVVLPAIVPSEPRSASLAAV